MNKIQGGKHRNNKNISTHREQIHSLGPQPLKQRQREWPRTDIDQWSISLYVRIECKGARHELQWYNIMFFHCPNYSPRHSLALIEKAGGELR